MYANERKTRNTREEEREREKSLSIKVGRGEREKEREREIIRKEQRREDDPQINVRKSNSSTTSMERRRMGTHFFDLMNIDSFQQEATDIDRSEYVSPRTNIKLSFHGDGALPLELDIHAIYETRASIHIYIYI